MKVARLGNKIVGTLVKDRMQYPGRLVADTFSLIARCGILLTLYWYVYQLEGGTVNGTTYAFVAWSMFFYFAFSTFRLRGISNLIMQDVKSGNVEVLFSKPVSYLGYRTWWQIGTGMYSFLVASLLGTAVMVLVIGLPPTMTTAMFLPTFVLVFLGASILTLIVYTIVGLLAFWIEDIAPVFGVVDKSVMILGGSYLPVALFPNFLYKIALYSPFGASQFVTHTVYESWQTDWYALIGIQVFWILLLGVVVVTMFAGAKKKVSINGG
ncbi:MAG TPA: hypothetical protein VFM02_03345 [Candidatus Paceibacterota bacterium]|nr:hypothetical protein [Candidatus Paceibacterota bacterium]